MPQHSSTLPPWPEQPDRDLTLERFLGLGERLSVKSYYPQLRQRLEELETKSQELEGTLGELNAAKNALTRMNEALEHKVAERTAALEEMLARLKEAQDALILSEKTATFGRISAGIANDLNSPLGAISSAENAARRYIDDLFTHLDLLMAKSPLPSIQRIRELIPQAIERASADTRPNERIARRALSRELERDLGSEGDWFAELTVDLGLAERLPTILSELGMEETKGLLEVLSDIMGLYRSHNILSAGAKTAGDAVRSLRSLDANFSQEALPHYVDPVNLDQTILEALENIDTNAYPDLNIEIPKSCGYLVRGQHLALVRTWHALLDNAIQAVSCRGRVSVEIEAHDDEVHVLIRDNGCGIPDALHEQVWAPFFSTRPPGEGAGFGLMVAKRSAERSGGSIDFTSKPGNTVFRVVLKRFHDGERT